VRSNHLRAFVGQAAFEELSRQWLVKQGQAGRLPFEPEEVGSHWSRQAQVAAVAVNWRRRSILPGERKWGTDQVGQDVIREMLERKAPLVLQTLPAADEGWTAHCAFFARAGLTQAGRL
jgi:hypothetical protein